MGQLSAGIKIPEALVVVPFQYADDPVMRRLLVENSILYIVRNLLVFCQRRLRHLLDRQEDLSKAPHARVQILPFFVIKTQLHISVKCDKSLLIEHAGNKAKTVRLKVSMHFCFLAIFLLPSATSSLCLEEPSHHVEKLAVIDVLESFSLSFDRLSQMCY